MTKISMKTVRNLNEKDFIKKIGIKDFLSVGSSLKVIRTIFAIHIKKTN